MKTPTFAIIGHPNEGKSSVLSTLAEDDRVRVSPIPGETTHCQVFPVEIDGQEVIRFIDTPGFQNPRKTLEWMKSYQGEESGLLPAYLEQHARWPEFRDDCELLQPVAAGAGVIFVVDGSRPVRNVDRAEMEILRLTGAARMAVINSKEDESDFIDAWIAAFRRHFNSVRIFNSCKATYAQRIELLESLKSIDQQLEPTLRQVISAFQRDWQTRIERSSDLLIQLLEGVIPYQLSRTVTSPGEEQRLRRQLHGDYIAHISKLEEKTQQALRALFRHNVFNIQLPEQSILQEDLFSRRTWEFLGLNSKQLIIAGAVSGAAIGVGLDAAFAGITFGVFSALGGLLGAAGTAYKGKDMIDSFAILGFKAGGEQLRIGPVANVQLLFILLDRCLLFYSHVSNWSHGRRDYQDQQLQGGDKQGITSHWNSTERNTCQAFFKALQQGDSDNAAAAGRQLRALLIQELKNLSRG